MHYTSTYNHRKNPGHFLAINSGGRVTKCPLLARLIDKGIGVAAHRLHLFGRAPTRQVDNKSWPCGNSRSNNNKLWSSLIKKQMCAWNIKWGGEAVRGVRGSPFVGDFNIIYLGPEEFFLILIQITFLAIPLCHLEVIVGFFWQWLGRQSRNEPVLQSICIVLFTKAVR